MTLFLRLFCLCFFSNLALAVTLAPHIAEIDSDKHPGKLLFKNHCAMCHDGGVPKAPKTLYLKMMPPKTLYRALTEGAMKAQARHLDDKEKQQVAEFLSGKRFADAQDTLPPVQCAKNTKWFDSSKPPVGKSWGIDRENTRFITEEKAALSPQTIKHLKLKWAFAFPDAVRIRSQPAIAGGALFIGSQEGTLYALDASSGCVHWTFQASAEVRTAIAIENSTLYFGDFFGNAYAVNAVTGELIWKTHVESHPNATLTGSPVVYQGKVYVPVSSLEVVTAGDPNYPCCTFRGSMVALDALTGDMLWQTYTIPSPPTEQYKNAKGVPQYGPSGAAIWSSPTIDSKRGLLYFGTSNNYSWPADKHSDAIFAIDLKSGDVVWTMQATTGDIHNLSCVTPEKINCQHNVGPDADFGVSPILIRGKDSDILVAGQKSGEVFGIDPDNGKVLWRNKVGRGGATGGVHFGMAAEDHKVFVPMHDPDYGERHAGKPGIYTLDAFSGKLLWSAPITNDADKGYSAAVTAIPGAVFACARDGKCRVFDSDSGRLLWQFNTVRDYVTVNGDKAKGGSMSGPGPVIADGIVYINSGYFALDATAPGNVLLAFSVEGK